MSYNLLLDTGFIGNNWKFVNCVYDNGMLISSSKVFGVEQELTLPNTSKLYFRTTYKTLNCETYNIKIGVQCGSKLDINQRAPKYNAEQSISVIDNITCKTFKVHIIFESLQDVNKIIIKEPLLVDLGIVHKYTWLKSVLDRKLKFRSGYSYTNLYSDSDIDFTDIKNEDAKVGKILTADAKSVTQITTELKSGHYYLCKLAFEEINKFGELYLQYGVVTSSRISDMQSALVFRADNQYSLQLALDNNCELPYQVNLKHILLIDLTALHISEADIITLPFN